MSSLWSSDLCSTISFKYRLPVHLQKLFLAEWSLQHCITQQLIRSHPVRTLNSWLVTSGRLSAPDDRLWKPIALWCSVTASWLDSWEACIPSPVALPFCMESLPWSLGLSSLAGAGDCKEWSLGQILWKYKLQSIVKGFHSIFLLCDEGIITLRLQHSRILKMIRLRDTTWGFLMHSWHDIQLKSFPHYTTDEWVQICIDEDPLSWALMVCQKVWSIPMSGLRLWSHCPHFPRPHRSFPVRRE